MEIRPGREEDVDRIMEIYDIARDFMRSIGDMDQWLNGYPSRDLVHYDIEQRHCFVVAEDEVVHAVFAFIIGEDPTYRIIEGGAWLNDEPYGTIHRLGSDGVCRGIVPFVMDWCKTQIENLRVDTHEDNVVMRHCVEKYGFVRCGVIYCDEGPRIAYQLNN